MNPNIIIKGSPIDNETRCIHYHSSLDIIAIKFKCCNEYYPCFYCHEQSTSHTPVKWQKSEFDMDAILCGMCKNELTVREYLRSNNQCPKCNSNFNPKCSNHFSLYFDIEQKP